MDTRQTPIRARRLELALSLEDLAYKVRDLGGKVSASHLAAIERGESMPSVVLAMAIAIALDTTVDALWLAPEAVA